MAVSRRLVPTLLAPALLAAACSGNQPTAPKSLTLVPAPAVEKLQRLPDPATPIAPLVAPRGGFAALQVAFTAGSGATVRTDPLILSSATGASLPAAAVWLLRDVTVHRPSDAVDDGLTGPVPDPLVPLPAKTSNRPVQSLYVEVSAPRSAQPGRYTGELTVHAGALRKSLPVAVDVAPLELPAKRALHTWFLVWDDRAEKQEHRRIRSAYHALLREERIGDGTEASADSVVGIDVPATRPGAAGEVAVDAARLRQERLDAIPYSYEFDEPSDDQQRAAAAAWGRALAADAPSVRQLVTAPPWSGLARGSVGTFAVHLKDAATALPAARALGADLWIYSSCCERRGDPTLLLDDRASANAAVAPATWLAGGHGLLYWGVSAYMANPWRTASPASGGVANGDGVLIYPGRPAGLSGPVPSLRLKLFSLGMQLVDLASLAEARGAGAEARAVLTQLAGDDSRHDGDAWDLVTARLIALADGQ